MCACNIDPRAVMIYINNGAIQQPELSTWTAATKRRDLDEFATFFSFISRYNK